jgi:DNA-binding CsgD family transcriptional regulator
VSKKRTPPWVATTAAPVIAAYAEALASPDARTRLQAPCLDAAAALVPASVAVFMAVSRRLRPESAIAMAAGADGPRARRWAARVMRLHDARWLERDRVAATAVGVLTTSGLGDPGAEDRRRQLAAVGMSDAATLHLRCSGTLVAVIVLLRSLELGPFPRADVLALRRLQPLVEQAYVCSIQRGSESVRDVLRARGLTDREADVAELIGRGATNSEAAHALHLGEATVKTHLTRIYNKLGVRSRTQLAIVVERCGDDSGTTTFG